jgi:hypothetical protein
VTRKQTIAAILRWAAAALIPFVLCVVVARPVGLPPGSKLIAHVDAIGHVWHYWHAADAVEHGEPLFHTTQIYFPMGGNHLLHRGGHLLVLLSIPIVGATDNPVLAHNLLALLALLLACLGGVALAARFSKALPVLLLGGCGLGLSQPVLSSMFEGQIEEALVGLLVLALLAVEAAVRRGGPWRIAGAGAAVGLAFVANMEFALFGALFVGFAALAVLLVERPLLTDPVAWKRLAVTGVLGGVLMSPLLLGFTTAYRRDLGDLAGYGDEAEDAGERQIFLRLQQTYSVSVNDLLGRGDGKSKRAPLALLALAVLGVAAVRPRRRALFWGLALAGFTVLAMGPELKLDNTDPLRDDGGAVHLPLYYLGQTVPFFSRLHFPYRYLIAGYLPLVALGCQGAAWMLATERVPGPVRYGCVGALAAVTAWGSLASWAPPLQLDAPGPDRAVTRFLAEDDGEFAVLNLPSFEIRMGPEADLFYLQQCAHRRPTFDGMGAPFLVPGSLRELAGVNPLLRFLLDPQSAADGPRSVIDVVEAADAAVLGDMGFRYAIYYPRLGDPADGAGMRAVLRAVLGEPELFGADELYRLPTTDGAAPRIDSVAGSRALLREYVGARTGGGPRGPVRSVKVPGGEGGDDWR